MRGHHLFALLLTVLVLANLEANAAGRRDGPRAVGLVAAKGDVWLDNERVPATTTVFSGDVISTGEASAAIVTLQSGVAATISENSEVAVQPEVGSSRLDLRRGALVIRAGASQAARVTLPGGSVLVQAEAGFPSICRVAFVGGSAAVVAEQGRVEIRGRGAPLIVPPGKQVRLEMGAPQAAGQQAGSVVNAIPEEVIQRQGKGAELALKLNDGVDWEDVVRTLRTGRVRIALQDGSSLNIGVRSTMRITKHDPQTQQTQIELTLGRLRGEVVKITKPGGSFEVRTQTAVIGVVGSIFVIQAASNRTDAWVLEGFLQVQNINPAIAGVVNVGPGQSTTVGVGAAPSAPVSTPVSQMVQQMSQTALGEGLSSTATQALQGLGATSSQIAQAGQVAAVTVSGVQISGLAANLATTVTGGTTAALSGVALSRAADARDSAGAALAGASSMLSAADAAAAAANQASETATDVNTAFQELIEILSPSAPCECIP